MRAFRHLVPALALVAVAVLVTACGGSSKETTASVTLKPIEPMGSMYGMKGMEMEDEETAGGMVVAPTNAHGSARLTQDGDHLTGTIEVTGLAPHSRHAEHLHGPDGACSPTSKMTPNMAVVLPDLNADAQGKAVAKVDFTVHQQVLAPGYFIMVHEKPTPASERGQIGSAPASRAFMQALSTDPGMLCGDVVASE